MNLDDVHRGINKHHKRRRIGRGVGSGYGKTSGRGHKGQGSRRGFSMLTVFEGGRMPLVRRIPKRGFHNQFADVVFAVNVGHLDRWFNEGDEVSPEVLAKRGLAPSRFDVLKILGEGKLTKRLKISAHKASKSAREKIAQAGGELVELTGPAPVGKARSSASKD